MRLLCWLLPYLLHTLALPVEPPHINNSLQSNAIFRRWSLNPDYTILPREESPSGQKEQATPILNNDPKPEQLHKAKRPLDRDLEDTLHDDPSKKRKPKKVVRFASPSKLVQVKEITPCLDSDDSSDSTASDPPSPPPPPIDHSKIPISQRRSRPSDRTPPRLRRSRVDRSKLYQVGKSSNFFKDPNPDAKD